MSNPKPCWPWSSFPCSMDQHAVDRPPPTDNSSNYYGWHFVSTWCHDVHTEACLSNMLNMTSPCWKLQVSSAVHGPCWPGGSFCKLHLRCVDIAALCQYVVCSSTVRPNASCNSGSGIGQWSPLLAGLVWICVTIWGDIRFFRESVGLKVLQPASLSHLSLVFGSCASDYPSTKDVRQDVTDLMLRQQSLGKHLDVRLRTITHIN